MNFSARRPGGTDGGGGHFVIGMLLTAAGLYLMISRVIVHSGHFFGGMFGGRMGSGGAVAVMLVPFVLGIAVLFVNGRSKLGWGLFTISLLLLFGNIITSLEFYFQPTGLPTFLAMFAFIGAGLGLVVRSLFGFGGD